MFDAFRATKGPDGERNDTARWSAETEARGRGTRERARGPHPRTPRFFRSGAQRARAPIVRAPIRAPPPHALASHTSAPGSLTPTLPFSSRGNRRRRPPRRLR